MARGHCCGVRNSPCATTATRAADGTIPSRTRRRLYGTCGCLHWTKCRRYGAEDRGRWAALKYRRTLDGQARTDRMASAAVRDTRRAGRLAGRMASRRAGWLAGLLAGWLAYCWTTRGALGRETSRQAYGVQCAWAAHARVDTGDTCRNLCQRGGRHASGRRGLRTWGDANRTAKSRCGTCSRADHAGMADGEDSANDPARTEVAGVARRSACLGASRGACLGASRGACHAARALRRAARRPAHRLAGQLPAHREHAALARKAIDRGANIPAVGRRVRREAASASAASYLSGGSAESGSWRGGRARMAGTDRVMTGHEGTACDTGGHAGETRLGVRHCGASRAAGRRGGCRLELRLRTRMLASDARMETRRRVDARAVWLTRTVTSGRTRCMACWRARLDTRCARRSAGLSACGRASLGTCLGARGGASLGAGLHAGGGTSLDTGMAGWRARVYTSVAARLARVTRGLGDRGITTVEASMPGRESRGGRRLELRLRTRMLASDARMETRRRVDARAVWLTRTVTSGRTCCMACWRARLDTRCARRSAGLSAGGRASLDTGMAGWRARVYTSVAARLARVTRGLGDRGITTVEASMPGRESRGGRRLELRLRTRMLA